MKRYLLYLVISFLLLLSITGAISYYYDPLGFFRLHGLRSKSLLGNHRWGDDRTVNALVVPGVESDTLLFGTSRVQHGFYLNDPDIRRHIGSGYNLALKGASVEEIDRYCRYALQHHVPSNIVIGLDFGKFLFADRPNYSPFMNYGSTLTERLMGAIHRIIFALWSRYTLETASKMWSREHSYYLDGTKNMSNSEIKLKEIGVRAKSKLIEGHISANLRQDIDQSKFRSRVDILSDLVGHACNKSIGVKLFISPVHVRQLLMLKAIGLQERFFDWKREVTAIAERHRAVGCRVGLVDFSRVTAYTAEPLPPMGDLETLPNWYWDSSHYNKSLGKLMLYRLWGDDDAPGDFGVTLTGEVIDRETNASRDELVLYHDEHSGLVKELNDIIFQSDKKPH
jgi:hypothetical protein